jgi:hypothetical protein
VVQAINTFRKFNASGKKQLWGYASMSFVPGNWRNYVEEAELRGDT